MKKVLLFGAPDANIKSIFNEITAFRQCSVNSQNAEKGEFYYKFNQYELTKMPESICKSIFTETEPSSLKYLTDNGFDCVIFVADAKQLLKSLIVFFRICVASKNIIILLTNCEKAEKLGIKTDTNKMQRLLLAPVIKETEKSVKSVNRLLEEIHLLSLKADNSYPKESVCFDISDDKSILIKAKAVISEAVYISLRHDEKEKNSKMRILKCHIITAITIICITVVLMIIADKADCSSKAFFTVNALVCETALYTAIKAFFSIVSE